MATEPVYIDRVDVKGAVGGCCGDTQLLRRLRGRDISALGELFKRHREMVYRTALAVTRDPRAAEDILQECFVRLYTYADSVDPERPLSPWLYRVTINLTYDWLAKWRFNLPLEEVLEWLAGAWPAPERRTEEQETVRVVREVVAKLSPPQRAVVVLFYMENLSVEEIAEVLELPTGTVKSRLYYARERLREMLSRLRRPAPEMSYEFT